MRTFRRKSQAPSPEAVGPAASRRAFLTTGAAAAGATVAATTLGPIARVGAAAGTRIIAWPVAEVPVDDPYARAWERGLWVDVVMDGQLTAPPMRMKPSVKRVSLRALHDGRTIGFRLSWDDPRADTQTVRNDGFRDAAAVLLAPKTDDAAVRLMGTTDAPVTLLHWKADWQVDVDKGFQDLESQFPRATFDFHPPLAPVKQPVTVPDDYQAHNATQWLPAFHVGNPIAQMEKPSPVEKLVARGFGSTTHQPTQNAVGRGRWRDGRWSVVIAKPMAAVDTEEIGITAGETYSMAIAVWAGSTGDAGSRKSPSQSLLELEVPDWR